jgi:hypothetical protein
MGRAYPAGPAGVLDSSRHCWAGAAFAFIHGMIILELNGRFPDDGGLEPAWQAGLAAFHNHATVAPTPSPAPH